MPIAAENLGDLIKVTQKDLGRLKFNDLSSTITDFVAMKKLLKKESSGYQSGTEIQFNVLVNPAEAASHHGLFATFDDNIVDVMQTGHVPWRHTRTFYGIDQKEIAMNRNPARIVDLVKARRVAALISLAELMETAFWSKPTDSTDEVTPWGVKMAIVASDTEGFEGGNPSGFSSGYAGLSSSTYSQFKNYCAPWSNPSRTDMVRKLKKGARKTNFIAPVDIPTHGGAQDKRGWYACEFVVARMEELAEDQNDKLGNDIASMQGQVMFLRRPVVYVPKLDSDSTNPFYGINWSEFRIAFLKGEFLREDDPIRSDRQPTVWKTNTWLTWNTVCRNRRLQMEAHQISA